MNWRVFAGACAVMAVCVLVGPRFFAARQTDAGADPSPPNAPNQKPAFPGQTRAPVRKANVAFDVVTVAGGFENPWSVAFLPDGRMLVTERPGRLRVVSAGLKNLRERIRDVRQGPDGALYVLTDSSSGKLLKLIPKR